MQTYLVRLKFNTAIHIGHDSASPDTSVSNNVIHADTFYSAILTESLNYGGVTYLEEINNIFKNGSLISDLMPYIDDNYFVPKPIVFVKNKNTQRESRFDKKLLKKLNHININDLGSYMQMLRGEESDFNPQESLQLLSMLGKHQTRLMSRLEEPDGYTQVRMANPRPFYYGVYNFNNNAGLYLILKTHKESLDKIILLIKSLGFTGIGGKKSSGLGKFVIDSIINLASKSKLKSYVKHLDTSAFSNFMSLSVCLPNDGEIKNVHQSASYILLKRSGFIFSETHSNTLQKKRDIYAFSNGSVFKHKFVGDIYDVSNGGNHKIYRYLKPFLIGV